jgi:hypothetical protein
MSVFLQPIYTQTVGATPVANITFNNIPQGFTDLYIQMSARTSFASNAWDDVFYLINDSTSRQYSHTVIFCVGNTNVIPSRGVQNNGWAGWCANANATANSFGSTGLYITDYTTGKFKSSICDTTAATNTTASYPLGSISSLWGNTAPITKLTFYSANGANFLQNTTITLYGVSNTYDTARPTAPTIGTVTDLAGFASVAFTPAANDQAESYVVTSTPAGSTTYGAASPIATPAVLGTSYTYQVSALNSLGSSASTSSTALTTFNSYTSIASTTVGSGGATSVTLSNIPQGYKNLELRIIGKSTRSGAFNFLTDLNIQFNTISSTSYSYHSLYSFGGTSGSGTINSTVIGFQAISADGDGSMPNQFGGGIFTILDYSNTNKNKVGYGIGGTNTVSGYVDLVSLQSGALYSLAPITSITIAPGLGTWKQNSIISLYGVN